MKTKNLLLITGKILILATLFISAACDSINRNNQAADEIYEFFLNAEIQYETEQQKESIITALNDILNFDLSVEELKNKKYPDYTGKPNQWDLPTLINKYFVPADKNITLGKNFYNQLRKKRVYDTIQEIVIMLKKTSEIKVENKINFYTENNNDLVKFTAQY